MTGSRFGRIGHGRIGVVPITDHPEPLEVALLHLDPMSRELSAFLTELVDRYAVLRLIGGSVLLLDDPFDRQAVAVPAGNEGGVLAEHLLRAVDYVLEDLVERSPQMELAIGIGRAVVQDEFLAAERGLAQPAVEIHLFPTGQDWRLALGQVPAHREAGLRQENGRTIIRGHEHSTFPEQAGKISTRTDRVNERSVGLGPEHSGMGTLLRRCDRLLWCGLSELIKCSLVNRVSASEH